MLKVSDRVEVVKRRKIMRRKVWGGIFCLVLRGWFGESRVGVLRALMIYRNMLVENALPLCTTKRKDTSSRD